MTPQPDLSRERQLALAAQHVRDGGILVLPTDTVYGVGTLAADSRAVTRLQAAKGRGRHMPPPVLVASVDDLTEILAPLPAAARTLMDAFWPGALTLVLDAAADLGWDLGDTRGTLAVRMPDHPLALALLRATGPMAVTSANPTGAPPATSAAAARAAFPGRTGPDGDILVLDGGPTNGPVPSTIVSLAGEHAREPLVLREGLISRGEIEAVLAQPQDDGEAASADGPPAARGARA